MNQQWKHRANSLSLSTGKTMVIIEHSDGHCQIWNKSVADRCGAEGFGTVYLAEYDYEVPTETEASNEQP